MDTHRFVVREISKRIKGFYEDQRPFRVYHGLTHSSRAMHDPRFVIPTRDLHNILDVNKVSKFAMVEPNVPMDKLVRETLKYGLIPPVVPSFPGTTVGGTFAGTAGGSSSFKYGFFDRAVTWLEIVLPDGKITRASRTHNSDLFYGMVGTLGSIGIATLFQVILVQASKYVELTYLPVESTLEALDAVNRCSQDPYHDFVEGLVYGPDASTYAVVAVGKLSSTKQHRECRFSRKQDDWFYLHALDIGAKTESIPLLDYLFRYDRGSFCMGQYCFGKIPFNKWTRFITDKATRSRNLAQLMQALHWADHFIIQDLVIPLESTYDILKFLEDRLKIYPLRICPIRQWPETHAIMRPNPRKTKLFMGIGIRGYTEDTIQSPSRFRTVNREIEHLVRRLGGIKWLYSRNYYTEDEFWSIYAKEEYDALRKAYNAEYLATVYDRMFSEKRGRVLRLESFWNHVFARTSVLAMKHKRERSKDTVGLSGV